MKISFDKKRFVEVSQKNFIAPRYDRLKKGYLSEWVIAAIFISSFGWFWYPAVALCQVRVNSNN